MKLTQLTQPQIQGIPVSQLPPHCHVAVVNLPAPEYGQPCLPVVQHPPLANQPDYQSTDRLVMAIEEVFFDRAFATAPGVVCSTTVNVTQFEDGRIGLVCYKQIQTNLKLWAILLTLAKQITVRKTTHFVHITRSYKWRNMHKSTNYMV